MRRFTFARGNARKVLALPLYGLGALASTVVRRQPNLWVFGSGSGVGEGALALLRFAREQDPSIRVVWLARNARDLEDAKALHIPAALGSSWRGFRLTLRARVIVVTHGFGDANRFGTRGGFVVQLWHGIPFKHIHLDSQATLRIPLLSRFGFVRSAVRRVYERSGRGIGMFATASPLAAGRIRTAFGLPANRVAVTGDPRDDVLITSSAHDARERMAALLGEPRATSARILLYAPTWRDGQRDPAIPTAGDWERITAYLAATDSLLVVRSHPLGVGDYTAGGAASDRVRMLGTDLVGDITPLLPAVDVLITDYSSIAFDFALTGGEVLFLAPDVAEYSSSRGVYESFRDFSGGTEVTSWAALLDVLDRLDRDPKFAAQLRAHAEWLGKRVHAFRDGGNTERVYAEIVARLRGDELATPASAAHGLTVDELSLNDDATLLLSGTVGGTLPVTASVDGSRLRLPGALTVSGSRWTASIPLLSSRWNGPLLPPPSGSYLVRIADADGRRLDLHGAELPAEPVLLPGLFRATLTERADAVTIDFGPPLTSMEAGVAQQKRLEAEYRRAKSPLEDAVFFESYFGQNVSSNPRGIDRALASARPEVTRYWSVADASVEVPAGAVAVIEGSEAWWRARASARVLVVNDWLRKRYRSRRGQTVLQTWHGTPLKRIALDRAGTRALAAIATHREKARWDIMLAQNQFSADTFRSAYAFRGPIWQEGYPRDDQLLTGDATSIRERLGIASGLKIVLYAPTWRDDRPGKVDHLDVASFSKQLGAGYVTLIRGHSRTMRPGADVVADGVIDVTGYPDISELFRVADSLITDYSSVMFDFTVTGKPVYFFAPDLAHYRDELRGFYFDLHAVAPGPVLDDPAELVRYVTAPDAAEFAERYAAWRARFNPRDDGRAGERVVARLGAEGLL